MKVPKGHAKRVTEICTATPREAVANLLRAMLPRVPIATRPVTPATMPERIIQPNPLARLTRAPAGRRIRTRSVNRSYVVLKPSAHSNHKQRTWTNAMVHCALSCSNTRDADNHRRTYYPEYEKYIDWSWLVGQGYITFD